MRRADRLFRLVELLRSRRHATGAWLAQQLQVSLRTLYRDIRDLSLSGVPIEGEAGVGYRLQYRLDVPPLLFDRDELEALLIGSRMVQAWADPELGAAAGAALAKIHNVLPELLRREAQLAQLFIPRQSQRAPACLAALRRAVRNRHLVTIDYAREDGTPSQRAIRPLGVFFWGEVWTLVAWCSLREDFRHFRIDRIARLLDLGMCFEHEPGKRLADYFDRLERQHGIKIPFFE